MDTSYVEFENTSRRHRGRFLSHFKTHKSSKQISSRSVESFGHVYASDKDLPPVPQIPSAWTDFVPSRSNTSDSVTSNPGGIVECAPNVLVLPDLVSRLRFTAPRSFSSTPATSPGIPRKPVGLADEYLNAAPTSQVISPPQPTALRASTLLDENVAQQAMTRGLPTDTETDHAQMAQKLGMFRFKRDVQATSHDPFVRRYDLWGNTELGSCADVCGGCYGK